MAKQTSHYDFSKWSNKACGPRPTVDLINTAHGFGKPGKQSLAVAMALRSGGTTANQVLAMIEAVFNVPGGRPQNNHRTRLIKAGWLNRLPAVAGDSNHTCYAVELTAKGKAHIAAGHTMAPALKAEPVKPAKAKARRKGAAQKRGEAKFAAAVAEAVAANPEVIDAQINADVASS